MTSPEQRLNEILDRVYTALAAPSDGPHTAASGATAPRPIASPSGQGAKREGAAVHVLDPHSRNWRAFQCNPDETGGAA